MIPILGITASSISGSKAITGAFESIATYTASGGETSFTFSSIPQTYSSLQVRSMARRSNINGTEIGFRPNNDTSTSSYTQHYIIGDSTTASAGGNETGYQSFAYNYIDIPGTISGAYSAQICDVLDYTSTSKYKTFRTFSGYDTNGYGKVGLSSNLWLSTSAITSLVVYFNGSAISANSTFALYGIKG
jgi:hypothetical protein